MLAALSRAGSAGGAAIIIETKNCEDEEKCEEDRCKDITDQINQWIVAMEKKYLELLLDRNNLYGGGPSTGSWEGHISRYEGMKIRLRNLIDIAIALKCPIPPRAYELLIRSSPLMPEK